MRRRSAQASRRLLYYVCTPFNLPSVCVHLSQIPPFASGRLKATITFLQYAIFNNTESVLSSINKGI
jgi:hypothetical protein